MLEQFVSWLADTRASDLIRNVTWVIPAVQTVHILAISAVFSAVMLIHLRSLRLAVRGEPRADVARRFGPIIWYGTLVLLVTGVVLIVGEPHRELANPVFQIKMVLLLVALALTALFQRLIHADPLYWDHTHARRAAAATLSVISLAVWIGIVFAGRLIAYADVT